MNEEVVYECGCGAELYRGPRKDLPKSAYCENCDKVRIVRLGHTA